VIEDIKHRHGPKIAYVAFVLVVAIATTLWTGNTNRRLDHGLLGACQRVNTLRSAVNSDAAAIHDVLKAVSTQEAALAPHGRTPEVQHLHLKAALFYERYATQMRTIAPTDCSSAVKHPDSYRPPTPQPFK